LAGDAVTTSTTNVEATPDASDWPGVFADPLTTINKAKPLSEKESATPRDTSLLARAQPCDRSVRTST
jgi:hypothetical protein